MLADLVVEGARTLAFVRSRRGAEVAALSAQRLLADVDTELVDRVAAYRGGYLPEERRALEAALAGGDLLGRGDDQRAGAGRGHRRAWTPWWWRASRARGPRSGSRPGRAGRARDEALVVLVARDDPLDTYLVHHPDALLGAPGGGLRARPRQPLRAGARSWPAPPPSCR